MSDATLRVIRKLLSRAEATDFESERDSCLAKVGELMARYSIEEALVWARDDPGASEAPAERLMEVPAPYAARKISLYGAVGEHAGCTVIDIGADPAGVRRVAAIGFPGDLDRMEALVTSLLVQMTRSMLAADTPSRSDAGATAAPRRNAGATAAPRRNAGATAAWRRSFITGFTIRVAERLGEARRAEQRHRDGAAGAHGPGDGSGGGATDQTVALALRHRGSAVDEEVGRRYPHLRSRRMDAGSSRNGHRAGRAAGDRAGLGETALRGAPALPR